MLLEHIASLDADIRVRAAALVDYFLDDVAAESAAARASSRRARIVLDPRVSIDLNHQS